MIAKLSCQVSFPLSVEVLLLPQRFPLRMIIPRLLPSTWVSMFQRYYEPSDSLNTFSTSSRLSLYIDTGYPARVFRVSHVHLYALVACRALGRRGCRVIQPNTNHAVLPSGIPRPLAIPKVKLTALNHFKLSPYGLLPPYLRLASIVTNTRPRLSTGYGGYHFPDGSFSH